MPPQRSQQPTADVPDCNSRGHRSNHGNHDKCSDPTRHTKVAPLPHHPPFAKPRETTIDLILWRHADALDLDATQPAQTDLDRALSRKGERQAQRMADWLNRQLPAGARLLASPARRTQQTAAALDRKCKTATALAPDGTVEGLLHAVRWPDTRDAVVVVGHQPTLGLVASYLLTGQVLPWHVRKGAVWWLRGRERQGVVEVVLHAVMAPELV